MPNAHQVFCHFKKEPNAIIKVIQISYTKKDINEFDIQIHELKGKIDNWFSSLQS